MPSGKSKYDGGRKSNPGGGQRASKSNKGGMKKAKKKKSGTASRKMW